MKTRSLGHGEYHDVTLLVGERLRCLAGRLNGGRFDSLVRRHLIRHSVVTLLLSCTASGHDEQHNDSSLRWIQWALARLSSRSIRTAPNEIQAYNATHPR